MLTLQAQAGSLKHHIPMDCMKILRHKWQSKNTKNKNKEKRCAQEFEKTRSRFPLSLPPYCQMYNLSIEELTAILTHETDLPNGDIKPEATVSVDGYTMIRADRDEHLQRNRSVEDYVYFWTTNGPRRCTFTTRFAPRITIILTCTWTKTPRGRR